MKKPLPILALFYLTLSCWPALQAQGVQRNEPLPPGQGEAQGTENRNRLDFNFSFERLLPNESYGDWKSVSLGFFRRENPDLNWYTQVAGFDRQEGQAGYVSAGVTKNWTPWFYTFTAVGGGTRTSFLPNFRVDHDFNFKFGPARRLVGIAGGSYIDYWDEHSDFLLSAGLMAYVERWVFLYRLFHNESNPGSEGSFSHLGSIGYGQEGRHWTFLNFSFGKQAYLATNLATPEAMRFNSTYVSLMHRHWLGPNWGVLGDVSAFWLRDAYDKYGGSLGFFRSF